MSSEGAIPSVGFPWGTFIAVIIIGAFSLLSLYLGFEAIASGRTEDANYYILLGSTGFAAMGYMIFRSRVTTVRKPSIPRVEVVTTLECPKCGFKKVRGFKRGDYVFKEDEPCPNCDGVLTITRIHRREKKRSRRW